MHSPLVLASRILGHSSRPANARSRGRRARPILESLERREVLSTFTWTAGDGSWDNPGNWQGNQAPTSGRVDIVFPSTSSPVTITLPTIYPSLSITSMTVQGGSYTLQGPMAQNEQPLNLAAGAKIATALNSTLTIAPSSGSDTNSLPLNFVGNVTKTGMGSLVLNNIIYFFPTTPQTPASQIFDVSAGTVAIESSPSLAAFKFQIESGATVFVPDGSTPTLGSLSGAGALLVGMSSNPNTGVILQTPTGVSDHFTGSITGTGGLIYIGGQGTLDVGSIDPQHTGTFDLTVVGGTMLLDSASYVRKLQVFSTTTFAGAIGSSSTIQVSSTASLQSSLPSTLLVTLDGAGQYTQLVDPQSSGSPVNLGGGKLSVALGPGYVPAAGDTFTIISSPGGIIGQFVNPNNGQALTDGQTLTVNNVNFRYNQSTTAATLTALAAPTPTATTTSLPTSSSNPSFVGNPVTFTATVQGAGAAVTSGTVSFFANGSFLLGTSPLDSTGRATFTTSGLAAGTYSITAAYNASVAYTPSTSAALSQTVVAPQPPPTPPSVTRVVAVFTQKRNAKGKPVGKPVFSGFEFDFSPTLSSGAASNPANYSMGAFVTKRVGRKTQTVLQPTGFTVSLNAAGNVVLMPTGRQTFSKGGQVNLNSGGLVSSAGAQLTGRIQFSISRGGKSIS
jgi:hypothetical protein